MEVLQRTANRGSISTGGYEIANSLKFERANSEKLARTPSSASNSKTWTYSFWLKRTQLGINSYHLEAKGTGDKFFIFGFNENDQILFYDIFSDDYGKAFTRRFRDTSAWYHIVLRADTTDGTASNRMRLYVNGIQETAVTSDYGDFPQNHDTQINKAVVHNIGYRTDINQYASGYMAETCLIDGTSLGPDSFGEFDSDTGIWKPIDVSDLTFGTNGFYQDYKTGADLGADKVSGGNSNDYTETNIAAADQATDTPTNNFCTLNPLFTGFNSSVQLPLNGATQYGKSGNNQDLSYAGTMGVTKGKWYFENYINEVGATYGARIYVGFHTFQQDYDGVQVGASTNGDALAVWQMDAGNYVAWNGGSRSITSGLGTVNSSGAGKVVGIALNLDDNQISFYYDGSAVTNGTNLSLYNMGSQTDDGIFAIPVVQSKGSVQTANFGGYIPANFISSAASDENGYGTFEYAPPSGYYALCTKNLAEYG